MDTTSRLKHIGDVQREPYILAADNNLLINGDFQVWQRGIDLLGGVGGKYTADRWLLSSSYTIADFDVKKASSTKQKLGMNARKDLTLDMRLSQYIEIVNADWINGNIFTLSFEAIANIAGRKYTAFVSKKTDINNPFGVLQVVMPEANKVYKFSLTFTVPDGSVTETDFLTVGFGLVSSAVGTYGADSVNVFQTGNLCIGNVKLEYGNVATLFAHRPYAEELLLCQRYFQELIPANANCGFVDFIYSTTGICGFYVRPVCTMRLAVPTLVRIGNQSGKGRVAYKSATGQYSIISVTDINIAPDSVDNFECLNFQVYGTFPANQSAMYNTRFDTIGAPSVCADAEIY